MKDFIFKAGDMIVGRLHKEPVMLEDDLVAILYPLKANSIRYTKNGFYGIDDVEPSIRLATGKQAEIGERTT